MRSRALLPVALALASAPLAAQTSAPGAAGPSRKVPLTGEASFQASEGATGTENPLAYDEALALGTVQVGQGPNAGTLVRVTNTGRRRMRLSAPQLAGSHPSDFAVEIESSTMSAQAEGRLASLPSPCRRLPDAGAPGAALALDANALADLRELRAVALHDFPLAELGLVTLVLNRRELPIHEDAKLVVDGREVPDGFRRLAGELQVWSGHVAGMPGSRVFLALGGSVARGYFDLPSTGDERILVASDGPGRIRLLRGRELEALGLSRPADVCAAQLGVPTRAGRARPRTAPQTPGFPTAALTPTDCRLAIETDWQLYQLFNSSALLTSYVTGLVAAASDQYFADVQTTLSIAYLGVHTNSNDGWTTQEQGGDTYDMIEEFRADWGTTWPAEAELAHFLSGAPLGGGIAYVDVLCDQEFGFGVSANLSADINWPSWTGAPGDFWDYLVFAHELGHNFGSLHTHDYCPPLDDCYDNCTQGTSCPRGTLMGYCHQCPGGVSNVDLRFHPVTSEIIRERVNASCMDTTVLRPGDFVQYRVRFNPWTTTGAKSAALLFEHDAPNATQPFRVQLSGTAN